MKIYFAGSIRGGRKDIDLYLEIINHLKKYGEVLTEHIADKKIGVLGEQNLKEELIYNRDLKWILLADVMIAEVSTLSLGVGFEIAMALKNNKRILCLYRPQDRKSLSAMINGCPDICVEEYNNFDEAKQIINKFLNQA